MIFGYLELESIVQVNDKTRLSAVKSYKTIDESAITKVEIEPESGAGFIQVSTTTNNKEYYLDWQYATNGTKTVSLKITTNSSPVTITKDILVVTALEDKLWSSDSDLVLHEPDILKWVPQGRNSFLDVHRKSQSAILEWLDAIRIHRTDGTRLEKQDLLVTQDVKELSIYYTLHFIFAGISNKIDDVFYQKAKSYMDLVDMTKGRGRIQADLNQNAVIDDGEKQDLKSFRMIRR